MSKTDFHRALYLCREVKKHLEELSEEQGGKGSERDAFIRGLEGHLKLTSMQMKSALIDLERSIEAQDVESMLEFENLIDALVDYLCSIINATERGEVARPRTAGVQRLKDWRDSAGGLAQILCQID